MQRIVRVLTTTGRPVAAYHRQTAYIIITASLSAAAAAATEVTSGWTVTVVSECGQCSGECEGTVVDAALMSSNACTTSVGGGSSPALQTTEDD